MKETRLINRFSEKKISFGEMSPNKPILCPKIAHRFNSGSAVRIFLDFTQ